MSRFTIGISNDDQKTERNTLNNHEKVDVFEDQSEDHNNEDRATQREEQRETRGYQTEFCWG